MEEGRHHRGEAKLSNIIYFNQKMGAIGVGAPAKDHRVESRHHRGEARRRSEAGWRRGEEEGGRRRKEEGGGGGGLRCKYLQPLTQGSGKILLPVLTLLRFCRRIFGWKIYSKGLQEPFVIPASTPNRAKDIPLLINSSTHQASTSLGINYRPGHRHRYWHKHKW